MNKIVLQKRIFEIDKVIKTDDLFILNNYLELIDALNNINESYHIKFFYFYKSFIPKILENEDKMIIINEKYTNKINISFLFYLSLIIQDNIIVVNYSYDFYFINNLYNHMNEEKSELKKIIICILFYTIIYYFNCFDDSNTEKTDEIIKEIKEFLGTQKSIINEFNMNLDLDFDSDFDDNNLFNIEDIYSQIIISLIRNKKFENYDSTKNIMDDLDLENIEITSIIYENLKNEFDQNSEADYIKDYKINNFEDLIKEENINFYYILLKYIFKTQLYFYNIQFLLETLNNIVLIVKKDSSKLFAYISKNSYSEYYERLNYILKKFLDSKYYIFIKKALKEILKYFETFLLEQKKEEIMEIKKIINNQNLDGYINYLLYYEEAIKWNKRYDIIKYIFDIKKNDNLNNYKDSWERYEEKIKKKTGQIKLKLSNKLFTYFNNEKNKNSLLEIFKEDEINYFIKFYNIYKNLEEIRLFYNNILFESKAKDLERISNALNKGTQKEIELLELEYHNDLEIAKQMTFKYDLIKKLFKLENTQKNEKFILSKFEEWENIKKKIEEKNIDNLDDNIKIKLFKYFNINNEKKKNIEILKEEDYEYLEKKKEEVLKEILIYLQDYYKQSKNNEIELIKKNNIQNDILDLYSIAKRINLRKPLIILFINDISKYDEREMKFALEKWEKIENNIINKKFKDINEEDKIKLINYIKNENNSLLEQIFQKNIIEQFLTDYNKKKEEVKTENSISNTNNSTKSTASVRKKGKNRWRGLKSQKSDETKKTVIETKDIFKEEKKEEIIKDKNEYIAKKILNKELFILLSLELEEESEEKEKKLYINDIFFSSEYRITEKDLNNCKEEASKNIKSKEYKIFEFIEEFKEALINIFNYNYKLITALKIEKTENDYDCTYIFYTPDNKIEYFKESEISYNKLSSAFLMFSYKINDEKYKMQVKENIQEIPEVVNNEIINNVEIDNSQTKFSEFNNSSKIITEKSYLEMNTNETKKIKDNESSGVSTNINTSSNASEATSGLISSFTNPFEKPFEIKFPEANKYQVLIYIKVIGDHREKNKRNTADFIKELQINHERKYISIGSDKMLKLYDEKFLEDKSFNIESFKERIYCLEPINNNYDLEFIACTNKNIIHHKGFKDEFHEVYNVTCFSAIYISNKGKILEGDNNILYTLYIAGRNGVALSTNKFESKDKCKKEELLCNIDNNITYRGLININDELIALTSNKVLQGGENKFIIYNIKYNKVEIDLDDIIDKNVKDKYSFIASSNGMAILKPEKENKEFLLCACKQYLSGQENGIFIVSIDENNCEKNKKYQYDFFPTEDFEVFCLCPIYSKDAEYQQINSPLVKHLYYFFVGGFDKQKREGKIKLYKLIENKEDYKPKIRFLQDIDIEFEEPTSPQNLDDKINSSNGAAQIINKNKDYHTTKSHKDKQKKKNDESFPKLKYFNGAISSIIQSSTSKTILASCYDGKVYLLSEPNLELYEPKKKKK